MSTEPRRDSGWIVGYTRAIHDGLSATLPLGLLQVALDFIGIAVRQTTLRHCRLFPSG